jgi:hypothetical protein
MTEFRDYFSGFARRGAQVKFARVKERNDDGTYTLVEIGSGRERRVSKASASDEFARGSWVVVGSLSSSRAVIGAGDVILSRAPKSQQGLSLSSALEALEDLSGFFIQSINPNPAVIQIGSRTAVFVSVFGEGFLDPPSYGSPDVIDNFPPVVTPTSISLGLTAGWDATPGLYSMTIEDKTISSVIQLVPRPAPPQAFLIAGANRVWAVRADDGTIHAATDALPIAPLRVVQTSPTRALAFLAGGGAVSLNPDCTISGTWPAPAFPEPSAFCQVTSDGHGFVWYDSGGQLLRVSLADGSSTVILTSPDPATRYEGVYYDAGTDSVFVCNPEDIGGHGRLLTRISRASPGETMFVQLPLFHDLDGHDYKLYPRNIAGDGSSIYVAHASPGPYSNVSPPGYSEGGVVTFNPSTLAPVATFSTAGGIGFLVGGFHARGGRVFLAVRHQDTSGAPYTFAPMGGSTLFRINPLSGFIGFGTSQVPSFTGGVTAGPNDYSWVLSQSGVGLVLRGFHETDTFWFPRSLFALDPALGAVAKPFAILNLS